MPEPRIVSGAEARALRDGQQLERHTMACSVPNAGGCFLPSCGCWCHPSSPHHHDRQQTLDLAYTVQTQAAQIATVFALHRRGSHDFITGDCALEKCDHEDGCPTESKPVCSGCWLQAEELDEYFSEKRTPEWVMWPCPTARALGVES